MWVYSLATEAGSLVFGVGKNLTANHTYTAGVSTF